MKVADKDPVRLFTSVAKSKGLDPHEAEARKHADEWTKLAFDLKHKFKRSRPWDLMKEEGVPLKPNKTSSTESPSYPSGHSMLGYGVAEFYKSKYPYMSEEWDELADIIQHSRLQGGVHFPSDNKASKFVVDWVVSNEKTAVDSHVETRRKQRAKYLDPKDLNKIESRVKKTKDLPEGSNYITLPHGRKAVVRTDGGKSRLATILGPAMRPPGRDVSSLLVKASGFNKEHFLKEARAQIIRRISPALSRSSRLRETTLVNPRTRVKATGTTNNRRPGHYKPPVRLSTLQPTAQSPVATQPTTTVMPNQPGFMGKVKGFAEQYPMQTGAAVVGTGVVGTIAAKKLKQPKAYNPNIFGKKYSHYKQANDLSVLTAVPKQNLDLIMRKGLASQKAISEDPELTKAFLDQRGLKEEDWRNELSDALKGFKPDSRLGASVFFSDPDPDKVSDPRHFINQFDTTKLRVNLGKLLKDIPETRFHGVELEPFNEEAWKADPDNYPSRRHRDLTTDEIAALIAKDPKELWKHYKDEYIGKLYAGDVPHGMVVTPSGIIPPEYLEQVEKTSSQRLRTTIFGVDPEGKLLHGFGNQGFYKFPGGGVDPGESIVDAAKRELLEEAGYDVESIEELPGLDTSDSVGASSTKGHMGHGSSLTKYLLARLGKRNESLLGSEGDAIRNLQTAPIDEVLGGLEGDMLFGSGVAESNHAALSRVRDMLQKTSEAKTLYHGSPLDLDELLPQQARGSRRSTSEHKQKAVYLSKDPKEALIYALMSRPDGLGNYAIEDGTAYYPEGRPINERGYVYKVDVDDYLEPKDPGAGIAIKEPLKPTSREEVLLKDHLDKLVSLPSHEAYRAKKRDILSKTSEAQPLLRHRSTLLIRDPKSGKLLAANSREDSRFNDVSPFYFPGGGLYDDEYDTPRNPTEEEILEGARREALEELGIRLVNPRVVGGSTNMLPQKWREKILERRGVPYVGGHEHLVLADKGDVDNSLYNVEGDAFTKGKYYDPQEVYDSLYEYGQQGGQFSPYNVEQARAIKENLLNKQAALEDEFQPDLTPDALKALGVYDQVYGDAPSEASMKEWPEHWINKQDPLGWLQWYDRYSGGRRTDDDERQMKRWKSFKARHLAQYLKKPTPRRAAALRNWGIDVGKY